jgi:dATP pyrophosphohydrolase
MARAPFNVLVFPYYPAGKNEFQYALLKRSDHGYWHAVAGGGEDDETPMDAAKRETNEETGISMDSDFLRLDTVMPVPVTEYSVSYLWGENVYVIPQYTFGVLVQNKRLLLSSEHTDYKWLDYEKAHKLVKYDGSKIALWELNRKLRGLGPRD